MTADGATTVPRSTPDANGLRDALAERGLPCAVEARERLAVLTPSGVWPTLTDAIERRAVHQLATTFGFTHVALELMSERAPGAEPAPSSD